jgi:hypothetical protein
VTLTEDLERQESYPAQTSLKNDRATTFSFLAIPEVTDKKWK